MGPQNHEQPKTMSANIIKWSVKNCRRSGAHKIPTIRQGQNYGSANTIFRHRKAREQNCGFAEYPFFFFFFFFFFFIFLLKNTWTLVRTALMRQFYLVPKSLLEIQLNSAKINYDHLKLRHFIH